MAKKLKHLKRFEKYKTEEISGYRVYFTKSECGKDWYSVRDSFQPETYKVIYNSETGKVVTVCQDATMIMPENGNSIIELESIPVPTNEIINDGAWLIENGKVVPNLIPEDYMVEESKIRKHNLMSTATAHIETLKDKIELGLSTDTELLKTYALYRIAVSDVDINVRSPVWPESPF